MSQRKRQFGLRHLLGVVAVCCFVSALIPYGVTGYHDYYTCALCRLNRVEFIYFDRSWGASLTETACTRWYADHVEPEHEHVWIQGRASALRNLYGQRFGAIDRDPPGRVIWTLTPQEQIAIYEHLPTPMDGKDLFLNLASRDMMHNNQDYAVFRALEAWKDSGFEGTW